MIENNFKNGNDWSSQQHAGYTRKVPPITMLIIDTTVLIFTNLDVAINPLLSQLKHMHNAVASIKSLLRKRNPASSKHDHGHALIIAGHKGCMGAAVIAARACLRSGVGLLTVNVPEQERGILQTSIPEAMLQLREDRPKQLEKFTAVGIGPAIGTGKEAKKLVENIITNCTQPLLLDADVFSILASDGELVNKIPANSVLTPHHREFDRVFGDHKTKEARIKTATQKAKALKLVIVLKGAPTLITCGGKNYFNSSGNAGLAKGGSGDALSGVITSLLAQAYKPVEAARLGVYIHGLAADTCLAHQSTESMLISDVIENLGKAFKLLSI